MGSSIEDISMFKWVCLLVAVAALAAFGWMLNDIRLDIKGLTERVDQQLPNILTETERVTGQLDRHLPTILKETQQVTKKLDKGLPRLMTQTDRAATSIDTHLPRLILVSEKAMDNLADLSENFRQYQRLMGVVHAAKQNKELLTYGTGVLNLIEGQKATIGVSRPSGATSKDEPMKHALPAKEWVSAARKDAPFLSLIASSRLDMLNGLTRTYSPAPLSIQIGKEAPRLLADWIRDNHPESKDLK
jgi:hypothetical protein